MVEIFENQLIIQLGSNDVIIGWGRHEKDKCLFFSQRTNFVDIEDITLDRDAPAALVKFTTNEQIQLVIDSLIRLQKE